MGAGDGQSSLSNAGLLVIHSGLAIAPFTSHWATGLLGRGLAFAAMPAATLAGTALVVAFEANAVTHGSLPEQRWIWGLFVGGMVSSVAGIVDAVMVHPSPPADTARPPRPTAVSIVPHVDARGGLGIGIAGRL